MNSAPSVAGATPTEARPRLLLVDDTPTNLQVLFQTLQGRDYEILVATSGEDALKVVAEASPDLILLDIMMPGIDGFETCRRLKAHKATAPIPVIFMSALNETADKVRGLDLGAVDYITKPFQSDEVIARVATHLTIRRLQRDLARRNDELAAANARMERDLLAAAQFQRSLLPKSLPEHAGATFDWRYLPCDELAGDSLGVFEIDDRHIGLYVLDVTGHGVPAALLSVAVTYRLLRHDLGLSMSTENAAAAPSITSPAEVVSQLNRIFPMSDSGNRFFTMVYCVLDTLDRRLRYCAAGHPGPIVIHPDGSLNQSPSTDLPVGVLEGVAFTEVEVELASGDRILCYSDGAIEEHNAEGELFGLDRLCEVLVRTRRDPIAGSLSAVISAVTAWPEAPRPCSDDISLLGFDIAGDPIPSFRIGNASAIENHSQV